MTGSLIAFFLAVVLASAGAKRIKAADSRELARLRELAATRDRKAIEEKAALEHSKHQAKVFDEILDCRKRVIAFLNNGPSIVSRSEDFLMKSLDDFGDRAYYPFWDNMEKSTEAALEFQKKMGLLNNDLVTFKRLENEFDGAVPSFPATANLAKHLRVSLETVERIQVVERSAHRDFEFSSIYAARKTNNILIAGFQNLSDALYDIRQSIDIVAYELDRGFESMARAQLLSASAVVSSIENATEALLKSNSSLESTFVHAGKNQSEFNGNLAKFNVESAERERFAIQALDNIQRNRRPLADLKIFGNVRGMQDPDGM